MATTPKLIFGQPAPAAATPAAAHPGMTAKDTARIRKIMQVHAATIEACGRGLLNFDVPAQRTINHHCALMGIDRLDWEKIEAIRNDWPFDPPPARILARWRMY